MGWLRRWSGGDPVVLVARALVRVQAWASVLGSTLWLKLKLRALGCSYGAGLTADGRVIVRVQQRGAIHIGRHVTFKSRFGSNLVGLSGPVVLECIGGGRISLGDYTGLSGVVISSRARVSVGQHANLGGNARIYDHDYHALDAATRRDPALDHAAVAAAPVVIGDDAFIGAQALILKGVRIGARAIIGAGAVVTLREVPADATVAGNPARVVKVRGTC